MLESRSQTCGIEKFIPIQCIYLWLSSKETKEIILEFPTGNAAELVGVDIILRKFFEGKGPNNRFKMVEKVESLRKGNETMS